MKSLIFFLCIILVSHVFPEDITLLFDIEIKEPEYIIFNRIRDIATDSKNNLYILDSKEKMIYLFNEAGSFLKTIGSPGKGPGDFNRPRSIYIDSKDNIYIFDELNRRIDVFDSEANYLSSIKSTDFPFGGGIQIAVDEIGELYISGYYRGKNSVLCKFSSTGELIKPFPLPVIEYKGVDFDDLQREMIMLSLNGGSICFDKEDRIFFSYKWPYSIKILTKEGNELFKLSREDNLTWRPLILKGEDKRYIFGESTQTYKIFFLNDKYLINSIFLVDWEGDPQNKIPFPLKPNTIEKYIKLKGEYAVLDFYTKKLEFVTSVKIDGKKYFLDMDKKGRLLAVKKDEEDMLSVVRYNIVFK